MIGSVPPAFVDSVVVGVQTEPFHVPSSAVTTASFSGIRDVKKTLASPALPTLKLRAVDPFAASWLEKKISDVVGVGMVESGTVSHAPPARAAAITSTEIRDVSVTFMSVLDSIGPRA